MLVCEDDFSHNGLVSDASHDRVPELPIHLEERCLLATSQSMCLVGNLELSGDAAGGLQPPQCSSGLLNAFRSMLLCPGQMYEGNI